jgi:hypothetical protein
MQRSQQGSSLFWKNPLQKQNEPTAMGDKLIRGAKKSLIKFLLIPLRLC